MLAQVGYGLQPTYIDLILTCINRLWNYNATNDNTHGDHWNGEDFSIFSLDSPPSPRVGDNGIPVGGTKPSLRQEAPNFAKEVRRRVAAQSAGGNLADSASEVTRGETDDEEAATVIAHEDSPFDRSYFCFDHESSDDDGRHHIEHVGGRALDAVVVRIHMPITNMVLVDPIVADSSNPLFFFIVL